jgi:hypothetical protein
MQYHIFIYSTRFLHQYMAQKDFHYPDNTLSHITLILSDLLLPPMESAHQSQNQNTFTQSKNPGVDRAKTMPFSRCWPQTSVLINLVQLVMTSPSAVTSPIYRTSSFKRPFMGSCSRFHSRRMPWLVTGVSVEPEYVVQTNSLYTLLKHTVRLATLLTIYISSWQKRHFFCYRTFWCSG